jgi:hypothetical protein
MTDHYTHVGDIETLSEAVNKYPFLKTNGVIARKLQSHMGINQPAKRYAALSKIFSTGNPRAIAVLLK